MERNSFVLPKILIWIGFVYLVTILFFSLVAPGWIDAKYGFPVHKGGDSALYMNLAENLISERAFTLSSEKPLEPEALRSPGYPGLVALILLLFATPFMVALIQFLMSAITGYFVFDITKDFSGKRVALLIGLFFWLNPSVLFYSSTLLSDIFFVFLETTAFWLLYREGKFRFHLLAFLLMGIGVLVRPAAGYLVILFAIVYFILKIREIGIKNALWKTLLCLLVYTAITVPWMYRNFKAYDSFSISSIGPYTLLFYDMDAFKTARGADMEIVRASWISEIETETKHDIYSPASSAKNMGIFIREIKNNPSYLLFHLKGSIRFFLLSGFSDVLTNFKPVNSSIIEALKWLERLIMALLSLAMIIAPILAWHKNHRLGVFLAFSVGIALYTALIFGPIPNARYRLAALPFILIPAGYSLQTLSEKQTFYRKRSSKE